MKDKILVIQPDEFNYAQLNETLVNLNYSTDNIYRCDTLLESFSYAQQDITIILADLSQVSRGLSLSLQELKRHFNDTPIIVLSDNNDAETYVEIIRNGGQCLLVNGSFDTGHLEKAIKITIERNNQMILAKNTAMEYERHFNNGPIPMWIVDAKTMRFLCVNNAAVQKYGYSKEEFSTMSIIDIRPPEDVEAALEKYFTRDTAYFDVGYWRHLKKNGEIFYVHVFSHATQFRNTEARLVFAVDVNAKLLADQKNKELNALIKDQKDRLDSILSSINDAIWSRTADTHELLYGNRAYYQLYGYTNSPTDPEKKLSIAEIHPADKEVFYEAIDEVKTKGRTELIYRHVGKDGSIKTLKASAYYVKGKNGKEDTIDGVTTDITREKELYDAIRNSEHKLLTTINNTGDLIWSVDKDLKIIFCNKAFHDFFYKHAGIALGEGDYVLGKWHSEEFIDKRKHEYQRTLNGESFVTMIREDLCGDIRYFEISSSPIFDVDENIIGVNCVSRDITEQENHLNKIKEQNEKLKEIAWIQSHKVRGPVASILGLLSLIEDEEGITESNKDTLNQLRTVANELDKVIKEIVNNTNDIADSEVSDIVIGR